MPITQGGLQAELSKVFELPDFKIIFLMFRYTPHLLGFGNGGSKAKSEIKTFEDLRDYYKCIKPSMNEEYMNALFFTDEKFKKAEKYLIEKLHQQKQIELYNILYEAARAGDVKSIKEFTDFSKSFFKEKDTAAEDEVAAFLKGIKIPDGEDE